MTKDAAVELRRAKLNASATDDLDQCLEEGAREIGRLELRNARLRTGLSAAIRAANLALFVIRKQNVMPNSSWQAGFEKDMATATAALNYEQKTPLSESYDVPLKGHCGQS